MNPEARKPYVLAQQLRNIAAVLDLRTRARQVLPGRRGVGEQQQQCGDDDQADRQTDQHLDQREAVAPRPRARRQSR